jgi:hypothetical protein
VEAGTPQFTCEKHNDVRVTLRFGTTGTHTPGVCACPALRRPTPRPKRAAPSRRHTQTRDAPSKSHADHQKPTRSAPVRIGQSVITTPVAHRAAPRKAFPGRHEPRASRAQPTPTRRKRPESRRSSARAAGAFVHTPTARRVAGGLHPSAPRRRHTQSRAAPFTSRADHQEPTRSAREVCSTRFRRHVNTWRNTWHLALLRLGPARVPSRRAAEAALYEFCSRRSRKYLCCPAAAAEHGAQSEQGRGWVRTLWGAVGTGGR